MRTANKATKEKFLLAAIAEIKDHGISDFSIRRAAMRCGTTSGAPYRHFKDRNELILEVLRYVNERWFVIQEELTCDFQGSLREELVEMSVRYIRFLCENPEFQTILTINDCSTTPEQKMEKARISTITTGIINEYCASVNMTAEDRDRKTYAVRSLIFGASLMINSGYMPFNEETLEMARQCIDREFDLA